MTASSPSSPPPPPRPGRVHASCSYRAGAARSAGPLPGSWRDDPPTAERGTGGGRSGPKVAGFWRSARFGVVLFIALTAMLASGPLRAAAVELVVAGSVMGALGLVKALLRGKQRPARVLGSPALAILLFDGAEAWARDRWSRRRPVRR